MLPAITDTVHPSSEQCVPADYQWRELPQLGFLSRQKFRRDKHVFVATKHILCRDKTHLLSRQNNACRDKTFVGINIFLSQQDVCRDKHIFVGTKRVCRDKYTFVATKFVATKLCRDKHSFVATNIIMSLQKSFSRQTRVLSRQNYAGRDKHKSLSRQNFVATSLVLSRQK